MSNLFDKLHAFGIKPEHLQEINANEIFPDKTKADAMNVDKANHINNFVFKRKFSCPVCIKDFESSAVVGSKVRLIGTDSDLKPSYEPVDPLYYDVVVCPHCGYASLTTGFTNISDNAVDLVKQHISTRFVAKQYPFLYTVDDAIERYQLALLTAIVKKAKISDRAFLCLKLAWLSRDAKQSGKEREYLEHAYKGFCTAYETESFPICSMDSPTLTYLQGELARRLGDLEKAMYFISRVLTTRGINNRLKDRALDVKEMIQKQKEQN